MNLQSRQYVGRHVEEFAQTDIQTFLENTTFFTVPLFQDTGQVFIFNMLSERCGNLLAQQFSHWSYFVLMRLGDSCM